MATFRHILAVPMLLTALGLGWVLSRQSSGGDGLTAGAAGAALLALALGWWGWRQKHGRRAGRSEEHTSELQSLMRISYAVFCLKKKKQEYIKATTEHQPTTK